MSVEEEDEERIGEGDQVAEQVGDVVHLIGHTLAERVGEPDDHDGRPLAHEHAQYEGQLLLRAQLLSTHHQPEPGRLSVRFRPFTSFSVSLQTCRRRGGIVSH